MVQNISMNFVKSAKNKSVRPIFILLEL